MKKVMWIVSLIPLVGTAVVLGILPESVPAHMDAAGNIDRWGSKYEMLIFPVLILVLAVMVSLLIRHFEKKALKTTDEKEKAGALSNARVLGIVGTALAAMFAVLQGFILYGAYTGAKTGAETQAVDIGKVSCILMGILFIVLGNFMTKTRTNSAIGVRMSWSMYNETTWKRSNRFGAFALMAAGLLTILTAALMKSSTGATVLMLLYLLAAVIAVVIYTHRVYTAEKEADRRRGRLVR